MADAIEAAALAMAKVVARRHLDREPTEKDIQYWMSEAHYAEAKAALAAADAARLKDAPMIAKEVRDYLALGQELDWDAGVVGRPEWIATQFENLLALITAQAARIETLEKVIEKARIYAQARQAFPGKRFEDVLENTGWDLAETYREFERSDAHARATLEGE